ncbi:DNA polymerase subunit Cdc27 [Apodospora peruviana]|uniref:DNA polymerase delta subunit 3 n=1 Tax=Apodospora peruviana TaxID=516989 RepID=A0AAE0M4B2_9PEZI|nr:DNA polymerase subunit Cdc27 [Apodospora peruviana]
MDVYKKFLAENILTEEKVITYRLLSRALHVHPNTAKQMLYDFHKSQNDKRPGAVHATYLVYGIKASGDLSSAPQNGADGDVEMTSSMPEVDSLDNTVPTFILTLIQEQHLKDALSEYEEVSSIHVYSVGPHPAKDLSLLADVANEALRLGPDGSKNPAAIGNSRVRRRERPGAGAKNVAVAVTAARGPAPATKVVQEEPKAAAAASLFKTTTTSKVKEEEPAAKPPPGSSKVASSAPEKKAPPALKRGGSGSSGGIMQAFSKAAATKAKKAEIWQPAIPSGDDSSIQPMSDDGEDDSEMIPQPKAAGPSSTTRKNREARAEELRRMMEEDDEEEDEEEKEESRPDSPVDEEPMEVEPAEEPAAVPEKAEKVEVTGDGRRRGKRKVVRKKQIMDDQGYLVTIQEDAWESFSEDDKPAPPPSFKQKTTGSASSTQSTAASSKSKKAAGPKGSQGSIRSFFSKN